MVGGWDTSKKQSKSSIDSVLLDPSAGQCRQAPVFPGHEGLPFRGAVPNLKHDESQRLQPQTGAIVRVDVLNLANDEDKDEFAKIGQLVANGYAIVSKEEIQYDPDIKNWRVFIRWAELYAYNPLRGHQHGHVSGAG